MFTRRNSSGERRGSRARFLRRPYQRTYSTKSAACIRPGTTPARKSRGTNSSAMIAYRMSGRLGGIRMPSVPEAAVTPSANGRSYLRSIIAGIRIVPMARAVATLEPQIAANMAQADHADDAQPAADVADPGRCHVDQCLGDAAALHERCRHDEEGNGQQGRRVELVQHLLGDADQRLALDGEHRAGGNAQHQPDRQAHAEQDEEDGGKYLGHRLLAPRMDFHGRRIEREAELPEPAGIAHRHQRGGDGQRGVVEPQRKAERRVADLAEVEGIPGDAASRTR